MANGDTKYRVWNYAKFNIGVKLMNGFEYNIVPGSFFMMTADDIMYIETRYPTLALFSKKLLVPLDENGQPLDLTTIGIMPSSSPVHQTDDEIIAMLGSTQKKIEAWISEIEDPAELHAIYEVAKNADLPASKIKLLKKYIPDKDWLDELGE